MLFARPLSLAAALVLVAGCGTPSATSSDDRMPMDRPLSTMDPMEVMTSAPKPAWAPDIDDQM